MPQLAQKCNNKKFGRKNMLLFFKKSDKINFEKDAVKSPGIKNFF